MADAAAVTAARSGLAQLRPKLGNSNRPALRSSAVWITAFPYVIHMILTDNGIAFADSPRYRHGVTAELRGQAFDRVCRRHGITRKVTRPYHPWTNGQAERMHYTMKDATVRLFHYATAADVESHITAFVTAYNFAKNLKALRWRTPYQAICDACGTNPRIQSAPPLPGTVLLGTSLTSAPSAAAGDMRPRIAHRKRSCRLSHLGPPCREHHPTWCAGRP